MNHFIVTTRLLFRFRSCWYYCGRCDDEVAIAIEDDVAMTRLLLLLLLML